MKKIIAVFATAIISVLCSAEHRYQNTDKIVYYLEGEQVYHTNASSVKQHSHLCGTEHKADGKIYMQLEGGCKKNHMSKCAVCKMLDAIK